jgi:DGQHR domain-containing protein
MENVTYDFLAVTQPLGTFYVCVMKAVDLLDSVDILRRGMSESERLNVQRKLNPKRQTEIASYLTDPDATFPTSIIISAYPDALEILEDEKKLRFVKGHKFGEVIDGQHRLEGFRRALEQGGVEELGQFELPVAVMSGLGAEGKAYVFSIINGKQAPVSSSLIFDLFGVQVDRSPMKVCHEIAEAFNAREGGPFYRGIKMLGRKDYDTEILTQGAFVKYLMELISRNPDEDARREKRGQALDEVKSLPLRELYATKQDALLAKVLDNYFSAIRDTYPDEWSGNPKKYMLRKTAGYLALLMIFKWDWDTRASTSKDASHEAYLKVAQRLRSNSGGRELTSANFGSSEGGAKELAKFMWGEMPIT